MIPACSDDTIETLRDLHPERSLNLNLENLHMPESLNAFWDWKEGTALRNKFFSVTKVRKYFRNCQTLGQQTSMAGAGASMIFISLQTMPQNGTTPAHNRQSHFPLCHGGISPSFPARTCGRPSVCVSQERWRSSPSSVWVNHQAGADAQLGSPVIVRETRLTHISPPHIQILCNAQVAHRMVPRDACSCALVRSW
jgi:hypothetical protein